MAVGCFCLLFHGWSNYSTLVFLKYNSFFQHGNPYQTLTLLFCSPLGPDCQWRPWTNTSLGFRSGRFFRWSSGRFHHPSKTPLNPWRWKKMGWNILGPQWPLRNYVVISRITWWILPKWSYFRLVNLYHLLACAPNIVSSMLIAAIIICSPHHTFNHQLGKRAERSH